MANISFGTDGFRGILDKDFNDENVEIIVKACAKYVAQTYGTYKLILIGYDPRNKADEYAKKTAQLLLNLGFDVALSPKVIPTPMVAFAAKHYDACAFMFTASHNPPEYLGLKFIPDYGGPATSEITDKITDFFNDSDDLTAERTGEFIKIDWETPYFDHLKKIIDMDEVCKVKSSIIFDGLYSATIGYFDKLLDEYHIPYEKMNCIHDPLFGGGMPDPKPKYLHDLIEKIKTKANTIGFSNDGDGDRFGVINEKGEYVTPNEIIGILLKHLIKNKHLIGDLAITVAGSSMLKVLAKNLNIKVIETPVGFKWLGEAMRKNLVTIAGEDSGGLSIDGHIPEKDGILANLLILEAMGYENKSLVELQQDLKNEVGIEFKQDRLDFKFSDKKIMKKVIERLYSEKDFPLKIKNINNLEGSKITFEDESWVLIRPSGTEPLLRIYIEGEEKSLQILKDFMNNKVKSYFL